MKSRHYFVYVIELWEITETRKRKKPDLYVGSSAFPPHERFRKHLTSPRASRYVRKRGRRLAPHLYEHMNPIASRGQAKHLEQQLANQLEAKGYRVYGSCSSRTSKDCVF